jgi:hypothetical protein
MTERGDDTVAEIENSVKLEKKKKMFLVKDLLAYGMRSLRVEKNGLKRTDHYGGVDMLFSLLETRVTTP